MDNFPSQKRLDRYKLVQIPRETHRELTSSDQSDKLRRREKEIEKQRQKDKSSKGSILFTEMQMLTNRIKQIDTNQEKLINERIMRNNSRQGSVTSNKRVDESINSPPPPPPAVPETIAKLHRQLLSSPIQCSDCRRRQQNIKQLQNSNKELSKSIENQQKQVKFLTFQLDLLKEQNKAGQTKQNIDGTKLLLRKILEKFMSDVVLMKMSVIDKVTGEMNGKIQKLAEELNTLKQLNHTTGNFGGSFNKKEIKDVTDKYGDIISIRTEGETHVPASSAINLRKRTSPPISSNSINANSNKIQLPHPDSIKIRTLQNSLKDKNSTILELEKEMMLVKKKNMEMISEYEGRMEKMRKSSNSDKESIYSRHQAKDLASSVTMTPSLTTSLTQQDTASLKLKQLQQKLLVSQKQYRKLNQRYLLIQRKQQELNKQLQQHRIKTQSSQKAEQKYQIMEKQMLLQTRELESVRIQLREQKESNNSHGLVIKRLKQKIEELQFQLSIKQQHQSIDNSTPNSSMDCQVKSHNKSTNKTSATKQHNLQKQFKIFQDSNNRLKTQIKKLNQSLFSKSKELQTIHDQYRSQLYDKQRKLYQLEMILKEDFSKIRQSKDSEFRISRESDNSLMFSTTRMISQSKEIDFILSQGEIIFPEMPNIEQLFISKDFSQVQLDTRYDQQEFLKKVSDYVDTIKLSMSRSKSRSKSGKSKSRSRNSSEEKGKEERREESKLKALLEKLLMEIGRVSREGGSQFARLKGLLEMLREELGEIEENRLVLGELREMTSGLIISLAKGGRGKDKEVQEYVRGLRILLKMSSF